MTTMNHNTPCANCERLEAYKEQTKHAVDINQKTVADRDAEIQHLQKQLEECLEVLKSIDGYKRYMLGVTVDKIDVLVAKLGEK